MMQINVIWQQKMVFEATNRDQHSLRMDAVPGVGGENSAFRPKEVLLSALAGCTGMDVISILRKMQALPAQFEIRVEADSATQHPMVFTRIHLTYRVSSEVPEAKLQRAIKLSQEQYCPVSAMLRNSVPITYSYEYF